ncbi:MAG: hypothetical protein MUC41_10605 [Syntrophobacteraceae bacterium]|nr:hypothetical protein [Syntrophobacteraceae bacterium]
MPRTICGTFLLVFLMLTGCFLLAPDAIAQQTAPGTPPIMGTPPTDNPNSTTWQYVRKDEGELVSMGGGSVEKGMNLLGDMGYELFIVTSAIDSGKAGYHFFRRPPCCPPGMQRPRIEYRRADSGEITKEGNGSYQDGLNKIDTSRWELVTVTSTAQGAVGFHYFMRPKQ